MCTAAGQKAASVELLDKANDKMNMQIGGVKWIAYLFFLDIFMTHRHVLWRHCSLIAPLPAAFCCYFIKIGCPAVVGARSGEEWRGPAGVLSSHCLSGPMGKERVVSTIGSVPLQDVGRFFCYPPVPFGVSYLYWAVQENAYRWCVRYKKRFVAFGRSPTAERGKTYRAAL